MDLTPLTTPSHPTSETSTAELQLVVEAVKRCCAQDFSGYSQRSIGRLINNLVHEEKLHHASELIPKLFHDDAFKAHVIDKLTVSYSQLFRDPELFLQLKQKIFPLLASYPRFSIWVAGCATGEEVYSLAIMLEEAGLLEHGQIYASDISNQALTIAASGKLKSPLNAEDEERYKASGGNANLADYFSHDKGSTLLSKLLSRVIFQHHDLVSQPSFISAQLILCRNVFIYFNRELQNKVLSLLLSSMTSRSYLAVGIEENLNFCTDINDLELVSRKAGLYRKRSLLK